MDHSSRFCKLKPRPIVRNFECFTQDKIKPMFTPGSKIVAYNMLIAVNSKLIVFVTCQNQFRCFFFTKTNIIFMQYMFQWVPMPFRHRQSVKNIKSLTMFVN
eukprot:Lithocolla_globosa_v1_NODE_551_length_3760_cov_28.499055.p5 type:complete len:102 gc:universal NODE_551_length_3760_cov_28.499055:2741-2436(-)